MAKRQTKKEKQWTDAWQQVQLEETKPVTLTDQSTMDGQWRRLERQWTNLDGQWTNQKHSDLHQPEDARQQRSSPDGMDLERQENGQQARHKGGCLKIGYQDKTTRWFIN